MFIIHETLSDEVRLKCQNEIQIVVIDGPAKIAANRVTQGSFTSTFPRNRA